MKFNFKHTIQFLQHAWTKETHYPEEWCQHIPFISKFIFSSDLCFKRSPGMLHCVKHLDSNLDQITIQWIVVSSWNNTCYHSNPFTISDGLWVCHRVFHLIFCTVRGCLHFHIHISRLFDSKKIYSHLHYSHSFILNNHASETRVKYTRHISLFVLLLFFFFDLLFLAVIIVFNAYCSILVRDCSQIQIFWLLLSWILWCVEFLHQLLPSIIRKQKCTKVM